MMQRSFLNRVKDISFNKKQIKTNIINRYLRIGLQLPRRCRLKSQDFNK